MSDSSVTRYLELDETAYENTIRLLIRRVHDAAKGKEPAASDEALHQFFTVALTKGANFLKIGFEDLAVKDAKDLALAASSLPDKDSITAENRQDFAKAAKRRTESAQWNDIFPDGQNDIILPLKGDAKTINQQVNDLLQAHNKEAEIAYKEAKRQQDMLTSGDEQQIAAYIEAHNRKAEALNRSAPDGQASGGIFRQEIRRNENPKDPAIVEIRNSDTNVWRASRQLQHIAGKAIEQTRLRIHPDDPNKLQSALPYDPDRPEDPTIPREADWKDAIRLGKFLEERMEWSLLDDFDLEKSRQSNLTTDTSFEGLMQRAEKKEKKTANLHPSADLFKRDDLRVVISRDPQKIGEMSSGQHWLSCMSMEYGEDTNFSYVPDEIETGALVAYVVSKDDPQARYPLMRVLLKPYENEKGETILFPGKIYGAYQAGNYLTRTTLLSMVKDWISEKIILDHSGTFKRNEHGYNYEEAPFVTVGETLDGSELRKDIEAYIKQSVKDGSNQLIECEETIRVYSREPSDQHLVKRAHMRLKSTQKKLANLALPLEVTKSYYRHKEGSSLDALPDPKAILDICHDPMMALDCQNYAYLFSDDEKIQAGLQQNMTQLSPDEKITWANQVLDSYRLPDPVRNRVFRVLAEALKENGNLTELDLTSWRIGYAEIQILTEALKENSSLTQLDLTENEIDIIGVRELAEALKENNSLKALYLTQNQIRDSGAQILAEALKENNGLTQLGLANNRISAAGAQALAEALKENSCLTQLDLEFNPIGASGMQALAEALKENTSLTQLHFYFNGIGDAGAQALAEALKENNSLTQLQLYFNNIGDAGTQALAGALRENNSLTWLGLDENEIGDEGAKALADALKENSSLTKLDLNDNEIGDEGAKALTEAIIHSGNKNIIAVEMDELPQTLLDYCQDNKDKALELATKLSKGENLSADDRQEIAARGNAILYVAENELKIPLKDIKEKLALVKVSPDIETSYTQKHPARPSRLPTGHITRSEKNNVAAIIDRRNVTGENKDWSAGRG